jgi:hypothetical protein
VLWEKHQLSIRIWDELPAGTYYFQLRAILKEGGVTEWTEALAFTIENQKAEVFPNPVKDQLNVRYQAMADETVEIILLNRYGKLLVNQGKTMRKGINAFTLNMPLVGIKDNPLTLQLNSRLQGSFTWQLLKE